MHTGSARVTARLRLLGDEFARLTLAEPLPLHIGDRLKIGCDASCRMTILSAFCGGSTVRSGSGLGLAGSRPKYFSTIGRTSFDFTSPTSVTTMFAGT